MAHFVIYLHSAKYLSKGPVCVIWGKIRVVFLQHVSTYLWLRQGLGQLFFCCMFLFSTFMPQFLLFLYNDCQLFILSFDCFQFIFINLTPTLVFLILKQSSQFLQNRHHNLFIFYFRFGARLQHKLFVRKLMTLRIALCFRLELVPLIWSHFSVVVWIWTRNSMLTGRNFSYFIFF